MSAEIENGVFLLGYGFSRGIDLKLQKDAVVVICLNGPQTLSMNAAEQMAGRGNRAQGKQIAHVIGFSDPKFKTAILRNCSSATTVPALLTKLS